LPLQQHALIIRLRGLSCSTWPRFKGDEFFCVRCLPPSKRNGDAGFQVDAAWDGSRDFSREVSVLPSVPTEWLWAAAFLSRG